MPRVNKYLVLHSGDRILMVRNMNVVDIAMSTTFFNDNLDWELVDATKDVQESASHIELVLAYKDNRK